MNYKVEINNRQYSDFTIKNTENQNINICPIENKLFNEDIISNENNVLKIVESPIRSQKLIPGVLVLKNSKTYGRKDGDGKLYYKMIPRDPKLPVFLVPYEIKNIGFSKVLVNNYIVITFNSWEEKHPIGTIYQNLGLVNSLEVFYEYELYCKSLNYSIQKFKQTTASAINNIDHEILISNILKQYPSIEDRTLWDTFTIDPEGSLDFDDGFSIKILNDNKYLVSVYIANVPIMLDYLNLWSSITKRVSTIYLPNKKIPMLPNILSDTLCSLQENCRRITFHLDIIINDNIIESYNFGVSVINCFKNFRYEEPELLTNKHYNLLLSVCKNKNNNINDSHELVSYLMILMNNLSAKVLHENKTGIFRSAILKENKQVPNFLPNNIQDFLKLWNNVTGQYILFSENHTIKHELLGLDEYVHVTSPIRRLVDLLNMIILEKNVLSEVAFSFCNKWLNEINFINNNMKLIKKIQNECILLDMCYKNHNLIDSPITGWIINIEDDNRYTIFLPNIKLTTSIKLNSTHNIYDNLLFKMYLFIDEDNLKKKIKFEKI